MLPVYLSLLDTRIRALLAAVALAMSPRSCATDSAWHPALPVAGDRSPPPAPC